MESPGTVSRPYHEGESEREADDGAPPGVRVLVVVGVSEEGLDGRDLGDALAVEELLALWLDALEEEPRVVAGQPADVAIADRVGHVRDRVHD